jgi:tetraacyldisaccharide-1-P 4'-kinase
VSGLARADAVLLTRTHEVSAAEIDAVRDVVERWVPREHIHPARLERLGWVRVWEESTPGRSGHSGQVGMDAVGGDADEAGTAAANGEVDDVRRATGNGRAFVITGIAQPESLLRTVVADGLEVCGHRVFRDHERIDRARFREVLAEARRVRAGLLICSEKDLANLPGGASRELPLWYPRVGMSIERGEVLLERIRGAMVAPECLSPLIAPQSTA